MADGKVPLVGLPVGPDQPLNMEDVKTSVCLSAGVRSRLLQQPGVREAAAHSRQSSAGRLHLPGPGLRSSTPSGNKDDSNRYSDSSPLFFCVFLRFPCSWTS